MPGDDLVCLLVISVLNSAVNSAGQIFGLPSRQSLKAITCQAAALPRTMSSATECFVFRPRFPPLSSFSLPVYHYFVTDTKRNFFYDVAATLNRPCDDATKNTESSRRADAVWLAVWLPSQLRLYCRVPLPAQVTYVWSRGPGNVAERVEKDPGPATIR